MKERMHVEVFQSYEELSRRAADLVSEVIQRKPDCVLGLATGSSPLGLYHELIHRYARFLPELARFLEFLASLFHKHDTWFHVHVLTIPLIYCHPVAILTTSFPFQSTILL